MNMGIPFTITWSFSFHEDGDTIDQREPSPSLSSYEQYVKGNRREGIPCRSYGESSYILTHITILAKTIQSDG